jgi:lipopolysaccharide export system permease protein
MAVVLMTVVAFGRLAAERELVAMQSGGISLKRAARPAVLIAGLITLLSVWLSLWVAPKANVETRSLYWDVLTQAGLMQLVDKTTDLGSGLTLYLKSYDPTKRELQDVRIERWSPTDSKRSTVVFAKQGTFENNQLKLYDYQVYNINYAAAATLNFIPEKEGSRLRQALKEVFPRMIVSTKTSRPLTLSTGLSRKQTIAQYADAIGADSEGWAELTSRLTQPGISAARQEARLSLNRKLALPFANVVLTLTALPFALRYGRSLSISLGLALLLAITYYLVFLIGLMLAGLGSSFAEAGTWLANILFTFVGIWLLRKI